MNFRIAELKKYPPAWHRVMFVGRLSNGGFHVTIPDALAAQLRAEGIALPKHEEIFIPVFVKNSVKMTGKSIQLDPFPWWARLLRLLSKRSDRGLGDTLNRLLIFVGGNRYKKWHLQKHGRPCQCNTRQTRLNARFPFPKMGPINSIKTKR